MSRIIRRFSAGLLATGLVATASPVWAHVQVDSTDASQGGFGVATFRVPNESDSAATTKLTVTLPAGTPFAFVSAEAKPGWKVSTTSQKLDEPVKNGDFEVTELTRTITWTATGDGIAPGQYDTFGVSGGPFPDQDSLVLPTTQTYADGEVVEWNQEHKGDIEPKYPAPTLALAASTREADVPDGLEMNGATTPTATGESSSGDLALTIAIAAAVVAIAALVMSVRQNRQRA